MAIEETENKEVKIKIIPREKVLKTLEYPQPNRTPDWDPYWGS